MQVQPCKTPLVISGDDLYEILHAALVAEKLPERSIVAVTSKIVSLCENRVVPNNDIRAEKEALVREEAEWYTDPHSSAFNLMLTIKHQILAVNAGIDESNADKQYVLFPADPYQSAQDIWQWLRATFGVQEIGVIITDSRSFPLKWGQIGTSLAYCGFAALNNKIGEQDLFGRVLHMTQVNVAEALAVSAVLEMGEAAESQPVAIITDVSMVQFQDRPPTAEELLALQIKIDDDAYAPILKKADWKLGGGGRHG